MIEIFTNEYGQKAFRFEWDHPVKGRLGLLLPFRPQDELCPFYMADKFTEFSNELREIGRQADATTASA